MIFPREQNHCGKFETIFELRILCRWFVNTIPLPMNFQYYYWLLIHALLLIVDKKIKNRNRAPRIVETNFLNEYKYNSGLRDGWWLWEWREEFEDEFSAMNCKGIHLQRRHDDSFAVLLLFSSNVISFCHSLFFLFPFLFLFWCFFL